MVSTHSPQPCQAVASPPQRTSPPLSASFYICNIGNKFVFKLYYCYSFSRISHLTCENVKLDSPLKTYASPRLDWMALRIQGKHFASKSELIIDPFPELQTTSVRAKSECSVSGRMGVVARQDIRYRHSHVQELIYFSRHVASLYDVYHTWYVSVSCVWLNSVHGCASALTKCVMIILHVKFFHIFWLVKINIKVSCRRCKLALRYAQNVSSLLHKVSAHARLHLFSKCSDSLLLWSCFLLSRSAVILLLLLRHCFQSK